MREILLALVFFPAWLQQALFAPDSLHGHMADRQVEFAFQPCRTEGGQLPAQGDHLAFHLRGSFLRMVVRSTAVFLQSRQTLLLIAAPPLAHRERAGGKESHRGLDAALLGTFHQSQTVVVGVFHFTHQIEITGGSSHDAAILTAARRPALPPARRSSLSLSSHSNTSTSPGGNDVPFQFHDSLMG